MECDVRSQQLRSGSWLIRVAGSIDTETFSRFEERFGAVADHDPQELLADMRGVEYISSSGLGAIFRLKRKFEEKGCAFFMYDPSVAVRRVLEISKSAGILAGSERFAPSSAFFEFVSAREAEKRKKAEAKPVRR